MRLRQVALVARDLDPVVQDLCAVLGLRVSFRDPGVRVFGLRNAVLPVGDTFLEVVSPVEEQTSAGRFLERRGGDGGYMVMIQSGDLDADRARIEALGVRVVWSIDLPDIRAVHLHPRDVGGAILSLDHPARASAWRWAGEDWFEKVDATVTTAITGVELQSEDPETLARRWSDILAQPVTRDGGGGHRIALASGTIRFVAAADGRGEGIAAIGVNVVDRKRLLEAARTRQVQVDGDHLLIGGTRIRFGDTA